ncbi:MAG: site-specific integrase, partial [Dehalococcoidia bacterium]
MRDGERPDAENGEVLSGPLPTGFNSNRGIATLAGKSGDHDVTGRRDTRRSDVNELAECAAPRTLGSEVVEGNDVIRLERVSSVGHAESVRLTQDQTFLGEGESEEPIQLSFTLSDFEGTRPPRSPRPRYRCQPIAAPKASDALLVLFRERAEARHAARTAAKYRWAVRDLLRIAEGITGSPVALLDLLRDRELLGKALMSATGRHGRTQSRYTVAHHRTAIRAVARLLKAELTDALGADPHEVVRDALRAVAEPRGGGYRLVGGVPRRRGGAVPTPVEVDTILAALAAKGGWQGVRDHAIVLLLARTASRVSAMRTLDARDVRLMRDGSIRLMLYQKSRRDPREVELPPDATDAVRRYVATLNHAMRIEGRTERIALGQAGALWRGPGRARLSDKALREVLRAACVAAGTPDYTPHALRRFWATEAASSLPRWDAALGGGWKGTGQFDGHYVQPSRRDVWAALGRLGRPGESRVPALLETVIR